MPRSYWHHWRFVRCKWALCNYRHSDSACGLNHRH